MQENCGDFEIMAQYSIPAQNIHKELLGQGPFRNLPETFHLPILQRPSSEADPLFHLQH